MCENDWRERVNLKEHEQEGGGVHLQQGGGVGEAKSSDERAAHCWTDEIAQSKGCNMSSSWLLKYVIVDHKDIFVCVFASDESVDLGNS